MVPMNAETKRIMIVDDDPALAELLADFCSDMGHEVRLVTDSREALSTAAQFRPHLVTLDLEMPHFDGMEVLRQLRAHPATDKVAVVIVSVVAQELALAADLVKGRFTKPVRFEALREKIKKIFELSV